ncbi:MAG: MlaD family protein [Candidatus Omnitrophica bacterium]|nr:MlaD family protein [Candidatus Omnitrophota bacterium]
MSYSSQEVKSGILITVALVILFVLTFIVGNFARGPVSVYRVQFGYVCGLKKDAPVFYAGSDVGRVEKIEILRGPARPVLVTIRIPRDIPLRKDSQAVIDTLGLLGEKFVEVTPGTVGAPLLPPGTIIEGRDPVPMYELITKANALADRFEELTLSLNPLVKRMELTTRGSEEEVAKIIANIHETTANLRDMTHELKFHPWRLLRKG